MNQNAEKDAKTAKIRDMLSPACAPGPHKRYQLLLPAVSINTGPMPCKQLLVLSLTLTLVEINDIVMKPQGEMRLKSLT